MAELPQASLESLRRLARGLVHDRHGAEDLVQEAWLACLRRRGEVREEGSWLSGAVRRLARGARREGGRRAERERRAARPETVADTAEVSARLEILRRLFDALEALDEPYRTAITLRFLEDLPPR